MRFRRSRGRSFGRRRGGRSFARRRGGRSFGRRRGRAGRLRLRIGNRM